MGYLGRGLKGGVIGRGNLCPGRCSDLALRRLYPGWVGPVSRLEDGRLPPPRDALGVLRLLAVLLFGSSLMSSMTDGRKGWSAVEGARSMSSPCHSHRGWSSASLRALVNTGRLFAGGGRYISGRMERLHVDSAIMNTASTDSTKINLPMLNSRLRYLRMMHPLIQAEYLYSGIPNEVDTPRQYLPTSC